MPGHCTRCTSTDDIFGKDSVWALAPTAELLAAARRNSELDDWLKALPLLP